MSTNPELYEQDFYAWTQEQATLLEARQFDAIDLPHLVEEILSLGISDRRALTHHLMRLVIHLLQWRYQPGEQSSGWRGSIRDARLQIHLVLEDSPSLSRQVVALLQRYYPQARVWAQEDTGLPLGTFPEPCPWMPEQILDDDF